MSALFVCLNLSVYVLYFYVCFCFYVCVCLVCMFKSGFICRPCSYVWICFCVCVLFVCLNLFLCVRVSCLYVWICFCVCVLFVYLSVFCACVCLVRMFKLVSVFGLHTWDLFVESVSVLSDETWPRESREGEESSPAEQLVLLSAAPFVSYLPPFTYQRTFSTHALSQQPHTRTGVRPTHHQASISKYAPW